MGIVSITQHNLFLDDYIYMYASKNQVQIFQMLIYWICMVGNNVLLWISVERKYDVYTFVGVGQKGSNVSI